MVKSQRPLQKPNPRYRAITREFARSHESSRSTLSDGDATVLLIDEAVGIDGRQRTESLWIQWKSRVNVLSEQLIYYSYSKSSPGDMHKLKIWREGDHQCVHPVLSSVDFFICSHIQSHQKVKPMVVWILQTKVIGSAFLCLFPTVQCFSHTKSWPLLMQISYMTHI